MGEHDCLLEDGSQSLLEDGEVSFLESYAPAEQDNASGLRPVLNMKNIRTNIDSRRDHKPSLNTSKMRARVSVKENSKPHVSPHDIRPLL